MSLAWFVCPDCDTSLYVNREIGSECWFTADRSKELCATCGAKRLGKTHFKCDNCKEWVRHQKGTTFVYNRQKFCAPCVEKAKIILKCGCVQHHAEIINECTKHKPIPSIGYWSVNQTPINNPSASYTISWGSGSSTKWATDVGQTVKSTVDNTTQTSDKTYISKTYFKTG